MKILNYFPILFFLGFYNSFFSQITIDGLKEKYWSISSTQFDDKSYVLSLENSTAPTQIFFFDENGARTNSKTLTEKDQWTFSDRPFSVNYYFKKIPLIDKANKLCYNLVCVKNKLSVQIVDDKLAVETIHLNGEVYSNFNGFMEYSEMIRDFDADGNPFWAITENRRGILYVKYNLKNKTIEHKFFEHEGYSNIVKGYDYVSAGLIGYLNNKIWYARVTDRGQKKVQTEITIYSIDENLTIKEEHKLSLNKAEKDLGFSVQMVYQNTLNTNENMYFTFGTISTNNAQGINSLYFIKCDGVECTVVTLADIDKVTNSIVNNKTFLATESPENEVRFVLGDTYGNALTFDVNFEEKVIANTSAVQLFEDKKIVKKSYSIPFVQRDQYVFTYVLFEKNMDEEISGKVENILKNKNIPIVFIGSEDKMFVISADYQEESTKFITQF